MRKLIIALTLLSVAACGAATSPTDINVVGTYKLKTINGAPVPYVVVDNATAKLEFLDDQIILTESGKYQQIGHSRTTEGGKVTIATITYAGTWTRTANEIVFRDGIDNTATPGNVLEKSLYVSHFGLLAAYEKQ
jgi:hypothetical protein